MLSSELYEALQLFSANMETERGDGIFILYLRPKLIPSQAAAQFLAAEPQGQEGKGKQGLAGHTSATTHNRPTGKKENALNH